MFSIKNYLYDTKLVLRFGKLTSIQHYCIEYAKTHFIINISITNHEFLRNLCGHSSNYNFFGLQRGT